MKKIIYISHVDWNWIKQRPQFLAEALEKNNVDVYKFYLWHYGRKSLQGNGDIITPRLFPVFKLPFSNRFKLFNKLSGFFIAMFFKFVIYLLKPDYVWVTSPTMAKYIGNNTKLIYDCMDDNAEFFTKGSWQYNEVVAEERSCVDKSDVVFCTSIKLQESIIDRYDCKAVLVRNAFGGKLLDAESASSDAVNCELKTTKACSCVYFGTISEWFDFESIIFALDNLADLTVSLYGPVEPNVHIPEHPKLIYKGVAEHSALYDISKEHDYLIMPFLLNDLILGVDPVKLYEYINFDANIISVEYPEIARFSNYVHFYSGKQALLNLLNSSPLKKYSIDERLQFLNENSWADRSSQVLSEI